MPVEGEPHDADAERLSGGWYEPSAMPEKEIETIDLLISGLKVSLKEALGLGDEEIGPYEQNQGDNAVFQINREFDIPYISGLVNSYFSSQGFAIKQSEKAIGAGMTLAKRGVEGKRLILSIVVTSVKESGKTYISVREMLDESGSNS